MRCPECFQQMLWNEDVNGFVCPHGCFAVYETMRGKIPAGMTDACSPVIDYLETVNFAAKEKSHGY